MIQNPAPETAKAGIHFFKRMDTTRRLPSKAVIGGEEEFFSEIAVPDLAISPHWNCGQGEGRLNTLVNIYLSFHSLQYRYNVGFVHSNSLAWFMLSSLYPQIFTTMQDSRRWTNKIAWQKIHQVNLGRFLE